MTKQEIDGKNLQDILKRIEGIHGRVYKEDLRNIIGKHSEACNFSIIEGVSDGEHTDYPGEKVKGYYVSDEHIFILILEREKIGQRKNAKDKKYDKSFLRFEHKIK